mmetsp:Transcript_41599/g.82741  ORF Transcript_41599/g.82741 Transcript_41599/m.82741 type:complete len:125 (-) Transcript_41599:522-896(-)
MIHIHLIFIPDSGVAARNCHFVPDKDSVTTARKSVIALMVLGALRISLLLGGIFNLIAAHVFAQLGKHLVMSPLRQIKPTLWQSAAIEAGATETLGNVAVFLRSLDLRARKCLVRMVVLAMVRV